LKKIESVLKMVEIGNENERLENNNNNNNNNNIINKE
jgi:hypothetical protein